MIDDIQKEQIRQEAKRILDEFALSLEKVSTKKEKIKKATGGYRKEGPGQKIDPEFRRNIFNNAQNKEGDYIIAEKKKW